MAVFVLDKRKKALMPCSEKRARKLLAAGRARVHRIFPFAIRVVDRDVSGCELQPVKLKIDPGSRFTGMAVAREQEGAVCVLNLFELQHRGRMISEALTLTRQKQIKGFQTGDMVSAKVPSGKKAGIHTGRVAVRATGSFNIQTPQGVVQGISHRHCRVIQRGDGYGYSQVAKMESEQVSHKARNTSRSALYLTAINGGVSRAT